MPKKIKTTPRKRPSQERAQSTVEALMSATARILVQEGYDRASTNRIAQAAGVSIGSLYQYFPNKEALVAELVERHFAEAFGTLAKAISLFEDNPLEEVIREVLGAMIEVHAHDPELRRIIIEQVPRVGRLEKKLDYQTQVAAIIQGHLERRKRELRDCDFEMAAFVLVHACEAAIHACVFKRPDYLKKRQFVGELTQLVAGYIVAA